MLLCVLGVEEMGWESVRVRPDWKERRTAGSDGIIKKSSMQPCCSVRGAVCDWVWCGWWHCLGCAARAKKEWGSGSESAGTGTYFFL